jgi:hypothetical protein
MGYKEKEDVKFLAIFWCSFSYLLVFNSEIFQALLLCSLDAVLT